MVRDMIDIGDPESAEGVGDAQETPGRLPLTFTAEEVVEIIRRQNARAAEIVMEEVAEGMVGLMVGQRMANRIVFVEE